MKKGQAAMEFLMTYGWAILVVLAAIGALAYFGILSPDRFLPSKCVITGGFSCTEYKLDNTADTVTFFIQNNLGVDAKDISVILQDVNLYNCTPSGTTDIVGTLANGVKSGAITFVDTPCDFVDEASFKGNILINYTRAEETMSHTATGSISGKFD